MITLSIFKVYSIAAIIIIVVGAAICFFWIMLKSFDVMIQLKHLEKKANEAKTIYECDIVVRELNTVETFHINHYNVRDRILSIIKTKTEYLNKNQENV